MNEDKKFGELTASGIEVGDIVEWSNWNEEIHDWSVKYGIITGITNDIKAGRLVSVSKVVPLNGPRAEVEFFTLSLRVVSHAKREELQSEVQG